MRLWAALLIGLVFLGGCRGRADSDDGEQTRQPSPSPDRPSYCPDTGDELVRGRVLVPDWLVEGAPATRSDVGSAPEARREVPARDVSVTIRESGEAVEIATADTDSKGRWCVDVGDNDLGMSLIARASIGDGELRRPVITKYGQVISLRSESVLRILEAEFEQLSVISPAAYLNLEAIASTAVDLLDPVEWSEGETSRTALQKVESHLRRDRRFGEKLDALRQ